MYMKYIKRPMDFILALCALILLSPVLGVTALLVKIKLGSPVLFKQQRPGLHEKIFTMYKFRTMTDERDNEGELLPDAIRLTKFGKLLRRTSLDELPELLNILKGDMSLVGPRPLLVEYLPLYNEHQKHRHDVRPGLSGWAQVNGRNALEWDEKFDLDVKYAAHISFLLDWKIIFMTIWQAIVKKDNINQQGKATMTEFKGNSAEIAIKRPVSSELQEKDTVHV